jgi:DNA-binding NarL/FixJ family response regulator
MITVVICSAMRLFGEALRVLLNSENDLHIAGHAQQWRNAVTLVADSKPDVVLLDAGFARLEVPAAIRLVRQESPRARTLVLSATCDAAGMRLALDAGAAGYVSKDSPPAELTRAIHAVHRGDVWVEPTLVAAALGEPCGRRAAAHLTAREKEILRLLASGWTNRDIARALHISDKTVKTHLNNTFRKLNVSRRVEAALYAVRTGLKGA